MSTFLKDVKFGLRMLVKRPGMSVTAVVILALGIGANTALFTIIHKVLLSPLPFYDSERIMMVEPQWENGEKNGSSSGPDYLDWKERNTVFTALAAVEMGKANLTKAGDALAVERFKVSPNFFDVFSNSMALGHGFPVEAHQLGNQEVVVLSHTLWKQRYGSDPNIINQQIAIDKVPHTVLGVTAPSLGFLDDYTQLYTPLADHQLRQRHRRSHFLIVLGRLKPDVSIAQAQQQMSQIALQMGREHPDSHSNKGVFVGSLQERLVAGIRPAFYILYAAVTLLLVVACVNISNLLTANAAGRIQEITIRQALGCGRGRLMRQLLTESMLLGLAGGGLGLVLAFGGLDAVQLIAPKIRETSEGIPGFSQLTLNPTILLFTLGVSLVTSLFFGLIPAWQSAQGQLSQTLKETGTSLSRSINRHRTLGSLVVAQIALAFVLLIGAGLLVKSFAVLSNRSPGFDPKGLLALHIDRPQSRNTVNDLPPASFFRQTCERLADVPGVSSAGAVSLRPLSSDNSNTMFRARGAERSRNAEIRYVTDDYFRCLGIPLKRGRNFDVTDGRDSPPVAIISQAFAEQHFPQQNPIGQTIDQSGHGELMVVGVVGNVAVNSVRATDAKAFVYRPHTQSDEHSMTLFIRTAGDPVDWALAARQAIAEIDENQPILYINKMTTLAMESISIERFCTVLLGAMAAVALFMALVGLYAVMTFAVNDRRREVGIRMALGAERRDILNLVIKKALIQTGIGLGVGFFAALIVSRSIGGLLYGISSWDLQTFIAIPILLFGVAMLACYLPARRATQLDPMRVLRYE